MTDSPIIRYDCPFCDETHKIEVKKEISKVIIKEEPVEYEACYYYCPAEDEVFTPGDIMDSNLLKARDEYRKKHHLLTSQEIKAIRDKYRLTQKEFSNLLGWGDITIQRYEKKLIQDETYDRIMRLVDESPLYALRCLTVHKDKFGDKRYAEIREYLKEQIREAGHLPYKLKVLETLYIDYEEDCIFNGYKKLDVEKVGNILCYLAYHVQNLYKVKAMTLLWYIDLIYFKTHGQSLTGLVYRRLPLGAMPIGFDEILALSAISVTEEHDYEMAAYRIFPKKPLCLSEFRQEELDVIQRVISFFRDMKTSEIVEYVQSEGAFRGIAAGDVISYEIVKEIHRF